MGELVDAGHSGHQQLLHGEFRRGVQVKPSPGIVKGFCEIGRQRHDMRFHAGRNLQTGRFDLGKTVGGENAAQGSDNAGARLQRRAAEAE